MLLLVEAQAPVLAARSLGEADRFATTLKDIYTACHDISRIAVTGSGMVTLLNGLRNIPRNGYALWSSMARVHLGATPQRSAAVKMAEAIIGFRKAKKWDDDLRQAVTAERVVEMLSGPVGVASSRRMTAPRPALVAYLADLMGNAEMNSTEGILQSARTELLDKLLVEGMVDAAAAVGDMTPAQRTLLFRIATGELTRRQVEEDLREALQSQFLDQLNTLCEPCGLDEKLQLLPPYGGVYSTVINAQGALLIEWTRGVWRLSPLLEDRLRFFGEHYRDDKIMKRVGSAISKQVLGVLVRHRIGDAACATLKDWSKVPAVRAVLEVLDKQHERKSRKMGERSPSSLEFEKHLLVETAAGGRSKADRAAAKAYLASFGLFFTCWLRHVQAHAYISKVPILRAGLSVSIVEELVDAAVHTWKEHGGKVDAAGVPEFVLAPQGAMQP